MCEYFRSHVMACMLCVKFSCVFHMCGFFIWLVGFCECFRLFFVTFFFSVHMYVSNTIVCVCGPVTSSADRWP